MLADAASPESNLWGNKRNLKVAGTTPITPDSSTKFSSFNSLQVMLPAKFLARFGLVLDSSRDRSYGWATVFTASYQRCCQGIAEVVEACFLINCYYAPNDPKYLQTSLRNRVFEMSSLEEIFSTGG